MDTARGIRNQPGSGGHGAGRGDAERGVDPAAGIGTDERRMHVRAYNHWVSLLGGRPYPSIEDLDPTNIADFGPHSVLLDFTRGIEDPVIQYLGASLRVECGIADGITRVADVPSRSLLSRLTDHYLQIIANRAPIGFEAEFVGTRGHNTLYRGILMPFSRDGGTIDYIYGVINWKEMVDAATQAQLTAEVEAARRATPSPRATAVWADGPGASLGHGAGGPESHDGGAIDDVSDAADTVDETAPPPEGLADRLSLARETAAAVRTADTRSRAALYRALGHAWEFARAAEHDREDYAELLADAGLKTQARAPMTPVVKLVFGADYDKTRLTEFATVLAHAARRGVEATGLPAFLDSVSGGIKGVVAAERALRRPAATPPANRFAAIAAELRNRPPLARVAMDTAGGEFVVLLARKAEGDTLDIVAHVAEDPSLIERVARAA